MITYRLAYRHQNGEVEGFIGFGFTKDGAKASAEMEAQSKVRKIERCFHHDRLIYNEKDVTSEELAIIRADWELYATKVTSSSRQ